MNRKSTISKALVVLSPEMIGSGDPGSSVLLRRAVSLAERTGCELELFHACYDSTVESALFRSDDALEIEKRHASDRDATRLEELATELKQSGAKVTTEVCWDSPRTDAILRKIARSKPDVVLKSAREKSYLLGLTTHIDWELARRSPAHVWLVHENTSSIDSIVAAVGNQFGDPSDVTTAADYDLLSTAGLIGRKFDADVYPVNAYRVTEFRPVVLGPVAPAATVGTPPETRAEALKTHATAVQAIAQYFDIPRDNVHIREGHPSVVVPEVAQKLSADMIIMGADSIGRLERAVSAVTVEPVMAESACDIFVVRERDRSRVPAASRNPLLGEPNYDVEQAILSPDTVFDSPRDVVDANDLSSALRHRILQAWEYDIRACMVNENEGGAVRELDVGTLDDIQEAKVSLARDAKSQGRAQARGMSSVA